MILLLQLLLFSLFSTTTHGAPPKLLPSPIGCLAENAGNTFGAPICSGHGRCVYESNESQIAPQANLWATKCLCDPGWSGASDFINYDGHDCFVHDTSFKALWGIAAILHLLAIFVAMWKLVITASAVIVRSSEDERDQNVDGIKPVSPWSTFFHLQVVGQCLLTISCSVSLFVVIVMRLMSENFVIGVSYVATFIATAGNVLFWSNVLHVACSWVVVSLKLSAMSQTSRIQLHQQASRLKKYLFICYALAILACALMFVLPLVPSYEVKHLLTLLFIQATAVISILFASGVYLAGSKLTQSLQAGVASLASTNKEERILVIRNLTFLLRLIVVATSIEFLGYTAMAWWPWLRTKFIYILGPTWAAGGFILSFACYILNPPPTAKADRTPEHHPHHPHQNWSFDLDAALDDGGGSGGGADQEVSLSRLFGGSSPNKRGKKLTSSRRESEDGKRRDGGSGQLVVPEIEIEDHEHVPLDPHIEAVVVAASASDA